SVLTFTRRRRGISVSVFNAITSFVDLSITVRGVSWDCQRELCSIFDNRICCEASLNLQKADQSRRTTIGDACRNRITKSYGSFFAKRTQDIGDTKRKAGARFGKVFWYCQNEPKKCLILNEG